MKKLLTPPLALITLLTISSFIVHPERARVASVHCTSEQYTDLETGAEIAMSNAFVATPKTLDWSLFPEPLPVKKVDWNVTPNQNGNIHYTIEGENVNGDVRFDLEGACAHLNLNTEAGKLRFKMVMSDIHIKLK